MAAKRPPNAFATLDLIALVYSPSRRSMEKEPKTSGGYQSIGSYLPERGSWQQDAGCAVGKLRMPKAKLLRR